MPPAGEKYSIRWELTVHCAGAVSAGDQNDRCFAEPVQSRRVHQTIRRRFLVAAASAMLGYGVMNLVMTATPLAMPDFGFGFGETATVIQWQVLAMFAPSLFRGHLIERFGTLKIIMTGALLQLFCVLINLQGQEIWNFITSLVLLAFPVFLLFWFSRSGVRREVSDWK